MSGRHANVPMHALLLVNSSRSVGSRRLMTAQSVDSGVPGRAFTLPPGGLPVSMRIPTVAILAIVLASGGTLARAQPPKKACTEPAHRQFDFWIGEWDVLLPDGKPAGRNHIVSIAGGCGLEEQWTGAGGGSGRSLNTYDAADKRWHQFWVGGDGTVLQLAGSFAGNVMTLENAANRIRFTRNGDGTIRQQWDSSADGGKTWKTVFDGKYVRARGTPGA